MRWSAPTAVALAALLFPSTAAADDDLDDPKLAPLLASRSPPPPADVFRVAPRTTIDAPRPSGDSPKRKHPAPAFKVSYRGLSMPHLDGSDLKFKGGQVDMYVLSRRWVRLAIELELSRAQAALEGVESDVWLGLIGVSAGIQFPWRVTPFVDGRFAVGLVGTDILDRTLLTYSYLGGIDAGIEVYLASRVYVTAALGWARPLYHGIDYWAFKANPQQQPELVDIQADTFTFKVGMGL